MALNDAQRFERETAMHETKTSKGLVNWISSPRWMRHSDRLVQERTAETLAATVGHLDRPRVVVIGVGGGGIFGWMWTQSDAIRIGIDLNHSVLTNALREHGSHFFNAVEADAGDLPLPDNSVDVVVFDFVLHHLIGQDVLDRAIGEAYRIVRSGGYVIAREPSSLSPSGLFLNVANRFRLMHAISGASNYEFALAPPMLVRTFMGHGSVIAVRGLSYLFSHRLPIWAQDAIAAVDRVVARWGKTQWFADFILYVARKSESGPAGAANQRRDARSASEFGRAGAQVSG